PHLMIAPADAAAQSRWPARSGGPLAKQRHHQPAHQELLPLTFGRHWRIWDVDRLDRVAGTGADPASSSIRFRFSPFAGPGGRRWVPPSLPSFRVLANVEVRAAGVH